MYKSCLKTRCMFFFSSVFIPHLLHSAGRVVGTSVDEEQNGYVERD